MADHTNPDIAALRKLEASVQMDLLERAASARAVACYAAVTPADLGLDSWQLRALRFWLRWRRWVYGAGVVAGAVMISLVAFWWRLASGPIDFDVATPWLTAAIEENFGSQHRVAVGGAQLERDAAGRTALRIRDIVVRDASGAIVASAPKAEVGISRSGLIGGSVRAKRLSLVGAEMQVRIEPDASVTVFAGANKQPFVTASAAQVPVRAGLASAAAISDVPPTQPASARSTVPNLAALLAWIDGLGASGLDGRDLSELGLKNGNLTVDDQRTGKQWTFEDINLSLTRVSSGGVALTVSSEAPDKPWLFRAIVRRGEGGNRHLEIETQKLPAKDLLLVMRIGGGHYEPDMPVTARIRAELGPDGAPLMINGQVLIEKGYIVDPDEPLAKVAIDRAEFTLDWDAMRHAVVVPFQVISAGNRITLIAQLDVPREQGSVWGLRFMGGTVVLASSPASTNPLVLNRFQLHFRIDTEKQRIDVERAEIGNMDLGVAIQGALDYSRAEPMLDLGVVTTRMSVATMKLLWPAFLSPKVRAWVQDHMLGGTVERFVFAAKAPVATLKTVGPPIPDDGLSIEIDGNGAEIRPVEGLPSIRDVDVTVRITGRTATVKVGRGNIELSGGRKLAISSGAFEVPDTYVDAPPARARFRLDGAVAAGAELLNLPRLREFAGSPVEASTSRGMLVAHVVLGLRLREDLPPGSAQYAMNLDISNFAAERLVMGQKVEASTLRVRADNQGYHIKGDVKVNGIPAALDYRKARANAEADVRVQATLDERARARLGFDLSDSVIGPVPVKIHGRIPLDGRDSQYAIEADLTQARIDRLIPGWVKPPGRPTKANFTVINGEVVRIENIVIEGPNTSVRGTVELDSNGDVISADLPSFNLSDGDKATLKAERGPDGALRLMVRGEVYDGRGFIKSTMAGPTSGKAQGTAKAKDIDVDVRINTVAGFHGETLRGLDLKMSRRNGNILSFGLSAKLGRDTPLIGDLRGRTGGRNVIYVETKDAGALFRFADTYSKIFGGEMWVAMDPPSGNMAPQDGLLNIRNFAVRGEAALERIAAGAAADPAAPRDGQRAGVEFSRLRVEFTRTHGRFTMREGIVRGPLIGATAEGHIDYLREEVRMRGTFVPFFGLNNMFGQIPVFGLFLGGGSNEGLVGLTYEVVGAPGAPVLRVNPISVVAPGLMRKFFEFPTGAQTPQSFADPSR
jgi:hypothetical protein